MKEYIELKKLETEKFVKESGRAQTISGRDKLNRDVEMNRELITLAEVMDKELDAIRPLIIKPVEAKEVDKTKQTRKPAEAKPTK